MNEGGSDKGSLPSTRSGVENLTRFNVVFPALLALVSTLIGAAISGIVSYRVADVSNETTANAQRESMAEQRDVELRRNRIDAYTSFLGDLDGITDFQGDVYDNCQLPENQASCDSLLGQLFDKTRSFDRSADGIVVYGSAEQLRLTMELQLLVYRSSLELDDNKFVEYERSRQGMRDTRIEFQRQMCIDVGLSPREDCGYVRPRPK